MTSRDFCFWLQGFFEIAHSGPVPAEPQSRYALNDYQVDMIRNHLALVFKHEIDPSMGPEKHQKELNEMHRPGETSPPWLTSDPTKQTTLMRC